MLKKIISYCLLTISIFLAVFITILGEVHFHLREQSMVHYLENADLTFLIDTDEGVESELVEKVKNYLEAIHIPEETMNQVLNSEPTKAFVGKYIEAFLSYLIYQEDTVTITSEEVKKLVEDNFYIIEDALEAQGLRLTDAEKEDILSHVDEYSDRILDFFPTAKQVFQKVMDEDITIVPGLQVDDVLNYLRFYLSPSFMITLIVLLIISLLVLALLNKGKRCYYYQRFFFIYAFIWIIGEILLNTIIKEKLMNRLSSANAFINYMINEISKNIWLIILVALLISFIISRINRKEKKNEKILTELCQEDGGEITEKTDY